MADTENQRSSRIKDRLKAYFTLNFENIRLTIAEKLILILSTVITILVSMIFDGIAVLFITIGIAELLALWLPQWVCYAIMAGVNILILLLVLIFRRQLIINPLSRTITKIILS